MSVYVKLNYYPEARPPYVLVDPTPANVVPGGQVTWEASGLPTNYTYEVDFGVQSGTKGPFPSLNTPANPARGVYVGGDGLSLTASSDQGATTEWPYVLKVKTGVSIVATTDAKVIIKNE